MDELDDFNVDKILGDLFRPVSPEKGLTLRERFDKRIKDLGIAPTRAAKIMELESRTLKGVLDGTQKRVNPIAIHRIASFLLISDEQVAQLHMEALRRNFPEDLTTTVSPEKVQFIRENFDLVALKKVGFLDSLTNYVDIEKRINRFFSLRSIEQYRKPVEDVAFSAGVLRPKNTLVRANWISAAKQVFETIDNPNDYSREALVQYFPEIRWHSTKVELGLPDVIRSLYRLGITVIYMPSLPSLHLRGATFSVHGKPCVALTNYKDFYPTLWFALVHELFHVIFDWDEIKGNAYHLSDEDEEQLSVKEREDEADEFARKYLFSNEKLEKVRSRIANASYVRAFAETNHVHESFIYVFYAFDHGTTDRMAWPRARRYNPPMDELLKKLGNAWDSSRPIAQGVKELEVSLYR